jgi:dihydrofolate reductase
MNESESEAEMRQLVLQVSALSLDGYITAEKTAAERLVDVADPQRDEWLVASLRTAGVHIMGRVTYESMAAHWPTSKEIFAEPMNTIPKIVFSRSLREATWAESVIAAGDTADEIARLKAQPGGDIIAHGGIKFAQSLTALGIVDEYRLLICPYAAGGGQALFAGLGAPRSLSLISSTAFPSGSLGLEYRASGTTSTGKG